MKERTTLYFNRIFAMVWNEKLKREIPKEWDNCTLEYYLIIKNGRDHKHLGNGIYPVYGMEKYVRLIVSYILENLSNASQRDH